jgi:dienelactone hydrolase
MTTAAALSGCASGGLADRCRVQGLCDFVTQEVRSRTVLRSREVSGPPVLLFHELPGLSPDDLALGHCLASEGFTVFLPLLFGEVGQDSVVRGYVQSCLGRDFDCFARSKTSRVVGSIRGLCDEVRKIAPGPVGAIGMCLAGAFPLALLGVNGGVDAAVLCQPTVPFSPVFGQPVGAQASDLGLNPGDLLEARRSRVPVLAMRYRGDSKCPPERMQALRAAFGDHVAVIEVEGSGHSTLAGSFDAQAFADTVDYLRVRLRHESGPARMRLARLADRPCTLGLDGPWRPAD